MAKRGRPRKLTDEQVATIQELAESGKNYLEIATVLGINKGSVRHFMRKYLATRPVNNKV